jgi:fibrillarin-like rRNA methylase
MSAVEQPEPFVEAESAAKFLAIERRQLLAMARSGAIPAYPASLGSRRRQWRFRLSELAAAITKGLKKTVSQNGNRRG